MRKFLSIVLKWLGKLGENLERSDHQKNLEEEKKIINNASDINSPYVETPDFSSPEKSSRDLIFEETSDFETFRDGLSETIGVSSLPQTKKSPSKKASRREIAVLTDSERSIRDFTEMMENPFLALSKKRKSPIIYESPDGTRKIKVTRHTGHFLASIYDWDIVLYVAGKMQEILNNGSDIPPRSMVISRQELLKVLHKHNVKKQQKDLENSLQRLKRTAIDTTIRNEDYRYKSDFGFVDSWEYTERKDKKEIKITLSQWLYDGICAKGVLLKVSPKYFHLTSALKRFLYRTARKHVGNQKETWEFAIEKLYEKSGSEREFRKFKSDLKQAVLDNDIPDYSMTWIERNGKTLVAFRDTPSKKIAELMEDFEDTEREQNFIQFSKEETLH